MGTVRKLIVEVVEARNLSPKEKHGTSSPYVLVDFYGQRRKTPTVVRDLNPIWNDKMSFNVGKPSDSELFGDMLELNVFHDKNYGPTRRDPFLGRIKLSSATFVCKGEEALIYHPLEKKHWFRFVQGEIGLRIYYVDEEVLPPASPQPPTAPMTEEAKSDAAQPPAPEAAEEAAPPRQEEAKPPSEAEAAASPPEADQPPPSESPPEGEKPSQEPPAAENGEAAVPPLENAAQEAEKPAEPEPLQPPTKESSDPVEPTLPISPIQPDPNRGDGFIGVQIYVFGSVILLYLFARAILCFFNVGIPLY